jgi:hypothetical protein
MIGESTKEIGRFMRGEMVEVWTLVVEECGLATVRYEALEVTGVGRKVFYVSRPVLHASDIPQQVKDRLKLEERLSGVRFINLQG